jgi:uncharacterized membrane protein
MNRTAVASSNIVSVGYDAKTKVLELEFKGHQVYQYPGFPMGVYEAMMCATSIGSFFAAEIKDRYSFTKEG